MAQRSSILQASEPLFGTPIWPWSSDMYSKTIGWTKHAYADPKGQYVIVPLV
jgi:hypothetical protein